MCTNVWNSGSDNDTPDNSDVYTQQNHAQCNSLVAEQHVYQHMNSGGDNDTPENTDVYTQPKHA